MTYGADQSRQDETNRLLGVAILEIAVGATEAKQNDTNRLLEAAAPSRQPFSITPHDDDALPAVPKRIYVGTGGNVVLRGVDGAADVTYRNLPNASCITVRTSHVRATGTTASNLIAEL